MAEFYQEMQDVASEVLSEFRQGVIALTKTGTVTEVPETPWLPGTPAAEPVVYTLDGTVRRVERKYVDGELIVGTEDQAVVGVRGRPAGGTGAATEVRAEVGDVMTVDGKIRKIKDVRQIPAAGTPVAYVVIMEG